MPSLFVIRGRDQGKRFELTEDVIGLGRDATNLIQLHDTETSRRHVELRRNGTGYLLSDLRSSNGTYINGHEVSSHELANGDKLQLGRTLLLYTATSDEAAEDLARSVHIVAKGTPDDGSRIVRTISQKEGSEIFNFGVDESRSPWLARARSNLQIMYRTALAVSHTLDIDELLRRILDLIFEWVEADRGCIMLYDPDTGELKPKVQRRGKNSKEGEEIEISRTILDYVVERNEGVLTSNATDDSRFDTAASILKQRVREAICVPMQGRYDVVGLIYIDTSVSPQQAIRPSPDGKKFRDEHLKLMIAVAHQAALAVEDTNYYSAMVQAERLAAVGQTVATLSHHVKNVLQGIRGGSYLIELGLNDHAQHAAQPQPDIAKITKAADMVRKGWGIVDKNQEKISQLVLDMLTFSKERDPEPAPSDMNVLVSDVVELMTSRAGDLGVEIVYNPDPNVPILMFDPDGLHRAVLNLVTNAIDACDQAEHGKVEVSTRYAAKEKLLFVQVVDNGVGISPGDIDQIFTLFVSKKGGRGTGLGLPVTQKMVQEHGGRVLVDSTVGEGSAFTIELPVILPNDSPSSEGSSVSRATITLPKMPD